MAINTVRSDSATGPFPGYKLQHFLGRGAYGKVWKATHMDGTDVALKFIPIANPRVASRELRALQSVRQLDHPNIVDTHRVWADTDNIVIVMELAEGSLLDLLDISFEETGRSLHAENVCFFLRQAAEALDFLNVRQHRINGRLVAIRHCDVKPSNLLLFNETVKLCDFSLTVQATSPMWYYERVGTLDFVAPEVFQGWISDRTDQFALAVTYCQLRSGKFPFPVPPNGFERNYVRPKPDLTMLDPIEQPIVAKALNHTPQDRWPSCVEFIDNIAKLLTH